MTIEELFEAIGLLIAEGKANGNTVIKVHSNSSQDDNRIRCVQALREWETGTQFLTILSSPE